MKVFISYSTEDKSKAESLYKDLSDAGAEVFQFERSATIGEPVWKEILTWIKGSDVFIVLVSKSSNESQPVQEEIEHAHYCYINQNKKPLLVSAVLERGVPVPILIERFNTVNFSKYSEGLRLLVNQLGIKKSAKSRQTTKQPNNLNQLFDLDQIWTQTQEHDPVSLEVKKWNDSARTILSHFDKVKPSNFPKDKEASYIDSLLALSLGKSHGKSNYQGPALFQSGQLNLVIRAKRNQNRFSGTV